MGKIFQPKIIIGSIFGFLTTIIGIIAIFFPSLFNLETKKIDTLTLNIDNCKNAENLFNFLKSHEDSIVSLNITYTEPEVFSSELNESYSPGSKDEDKKNVYKAFNPEWLEITEKNTASLFGENKLFNVKSDSRLYPYGQSFSRENGGFGFWCRNNKTTPEKELDFAYQISIPYKSNGNTLYYWGEKNNKNGDTSNARIISLNGTFYVNKLANADEYQKNENYFMYPDWCEEKSYQYGADKCGIPDIFDIEPLSKKEIELKKY